MRAGLVRRLLMLAAVLVSAWVAACARPATPPRHVAIAAASDLRFALDAIVAALRQEAPDLAVDVTYGSSGTLYAQLVNHAPHDMFLSADREYPRRLAEKGLTLAGSEFVYGIGRLALWVPGSISGEAGIPLLTQPSIAHIAIANPEHAPYGDAARQALQSAGIWDRVSSRLVFGENISQTLQFAETGNVDAAIVALSLSVTSKGRWVLISDQLHKPLNQALAVVRSTRHETEARRFASFVNSTQGRQVMRKYGFILPGEEPVK